MHFTVGKAVTVALVGLGNVLLTANAAPAEIVRARDSNVPGNHLPRYADHIAPLVVARSPKGGKGDGPTSGWSDSSDSDSSDGSSGDGPNPGGFGVAPTPGDGASAGSDPNPGAFGNPPPKNTNDGSNSGGGSGTDNPPTVAEGTVDLRERGYRVERQTDGDISTFKIHGAAGDRERMLVDMSVDSKGNSYTIREAWNKDDTTPNKPRLAEMVHSIWVNDMGKRPGDLDTVRIQSITEETTKPVLIDAKAKKGDSNDYTVTRNSEDPVDREIFENISGAAWGKHVQKTLDLGGAGKQIESYRVQQFNLLIKVA